MSFQLLIVDDEIHAIEGVKSDLDKEKLGISTIHTAYSMRQAIQIIEQEQIDIMLCDIEMPQGSGLELLAWVREHYPNIITIFLTSHADFHYAKEAIQLGSLDYLLKPVHTSELEKAIVRAKHIVEDHTEANRNKQSHQLWMKHRVLVVERFWSDLINQTIPSNPYHIREQADVHQLPISDDSMFLPILISIQKWNRELSRRDEKIMEYALKNSAEEMILGNQYNGVFFYLDKGYLLGIFTVDKGEHAQQDVAALQQLASGYIKACRQYFYCDLSCYFGKVVKAQEVASMVTLLKERDRHNVAFYNQVFPCDNELNAPQVIELPDFHVWLSLLKTGKKDGVIAEVEKYLNGLVSNQAINANILHQFHQDFIQALYSYLNMQGIQARQLYGDEASRMYSERAGRSVSELLNWVYYVLDKAITQTMVAEESETILQTVKRFIKNHIDQELNRDMIANHVFLNPDYLSRILKRETGYSVSDYVLIERINLAKELLATTNIPVSSIAASVGHTNFSHFAKIFKKHTGVGPSEYRAQFHS